MKRILVRKDAYYDSVFLMLATRELEGTEGVDGAVVAMGTPMNLELLTGLGYGSAEGGGALASAGPGDLVVAVDCADAAAAEKAIALAIDLVTKKKGPAAQAGQAYPRAASTAGALKLLPEANLAIVSVPGAYAAREARLALERGLHVMVFSDNVSLEDEIALKTLAASKGLLLMGPDCGTAIIGGKPLCFANVVARGPVGIVAASGTGLQEVSCLVDRAGVGVSQAIGCGGRDLKNAKVGGMTSLLAIEGLERDPETKVLLVVSKPPAPETAAKVVAALERGGKPAVAHFLGLKDRPADRDPVYHAASLEEAAALAAAFAKNGADAAARMAAAAAVRARLDAEAAQGVGELTGREAARLAPGQKFLRGLYAGGTVADEALFIAEAALGQVRSNNQTDPSLVLADPRTSEGHTIVDLGDDAFTVGKPHPMIDPSQRNARIVEEGKDPSTAVLLLDVVLGYGSHDDPAGASLEAIAGARAAAAARGGYLPVVASVIGTGADPQGYGAQVAKLEAAGVVVMPSNRRAALLAVEIAKAAARGSSAKGGAR